MKIAIDARLLGPEGSGIGRYLDNLLKEIDLIDHKNEYMVLLRKANFHLFNPTGKNFKKIITNANWYGVKEQIVVPAVLTRERPNLVHFPHFNVPLLWSGNYVLTIHDTTTSEFGSSASSRQLLPVFLTKRLGYQLVLNQAIRRAKKIMVPSNFVKDSLIQKFSLKEDKINVAYEAADKIFLENGQKKFSAGLVKEVLAKYGVKPPFLIYVGNLYPYKNVEIVLETLKNIEPNLSFVVAGIRNSFTPSLVEKVRKLNLEERVRVAGFVPDEELIILLQNAEALVFPSLSEGFGLPGLEAMACGCPVISSKKTALPEIYGKAAVYFDPHSPSDLKKKISDLLKNKNKKKELIKEGLEKVGSYSWKTLAQKTLSVYTQVGEKKQKKDSQKTN